MIQYIESENRFLDVLPTGRELYLFGAGYRFRKLLWMQRQGFIDRIPIKAVLVTHKEQVEVLGIPVLELKEADCFIPVFVIVQELFHREICDSLRRAGLTHIYLMKDVEYSKWMNRFRRYYFGKKGLCYHEFHAMDRGQKRKRLCNRLMTYCVIHEADQILKESDSCRWWETKIQAGASGSSRKLTAVRDDVGDNISEKNRFYNELTAIYWVWKNTDWPYTGICHYRRRFITDDIWRAVAEEGYDAVLAAPDILYDSMEKHYAVEHDAYEFSVMLEAIRKVTPEYYPAALWCAKEHILFPCNIFIAKREIYGEYCDWLFTVIAYMEEIFRKNVSYIPGRYFFSERLTTIFFMHHKSKWTFCYEPIKIFH